MSKSLYDIVHIHVFIESFDGSNDVLNTDIAVKIFTALEENHWLIYSRSFQYKE